MGFYAVPYRVLFHDTMAYGSHHFLTNFKFQCIAREAFFFSHIVDESPQGRQAHDELVLLTREGYARNLNPVAVGRKVGILITVEAQTPSTVRFCFRVIDENGEPVTCGYQSLVSVAEASGQIVTAPPALVSHFDAMREETTSFQELIHQGRVKQLFPPSICNLGKQLAKGEMAEGFLSIDVTHPALPLGPKAWLFPGQGSFNPHLFRWLTHHVTEADSWLDRADRLSRQYLDLPLRSQLLERSEIHPEAQQWGIFLSAVLCAKWLQQQDAKVDVLVGHSAGELAVLPIAGVLSQDDSLKLVLYRILALRQVTPNIGAMISIKATRHEMDSLLDNMQPHPWELAVRNHKERWVIAGPRADSDRFLRLAKEKNLAARLVDSPFPFHTSHLTACVPIFAGLLKKLHFKPPQINIYSALAGRVLGNQEDWPKLLSHHFVETLNFAEAIENLRERGVNYVTHCGPNHALMSLFRRKDDRPDQFHSPFKAATIPPSRPQLKREIPGIGGDPHRGSLAGDEPIAIVGMGCVLPGSHDTEQFWQRLLSGEHALSHLDAYHPQMGTDFKKPGRPHADKTYTLLGGYIHDYEPPEICLPYAHQWSKAQQYLAGAAHQCQTQLGHQQSLTTGIYIGATADGSGEFDEALLREHLAEQFSADLNGFGTSRNPPTPKPVSAESLAPENAYRQVLDHFWPKESSLLTLDAACASSIYAVILGIQALRQNQLDLAICGGVFAPGPANSCLFSQFGGLSANHSRPLDAKADGVVFGEGAALVGLKRLSQALRDGDVIHGVLRGYGMSSDGKSASVALPKSEGQVLAMERAYQSSAIDRSSIQYVEAHATATSVGDAVEFAALQKTFAGHAPPTKRYLGSVKGLLGHTGWAAGIASLIKMTLALKHRMIPPQSSYEQPNPKIDLTTANFCVPTEPTIWPENQANPRRCAINGFGFGGTNAHIILEDFDSGYHHSWHAEAKKKSPEELVIVGWHAKFAESDANSKEVGTQFSEDSLKIPSGLLILPDALDEMDRSQRLAVICAHEAMAPLGLLAKDIKQHTGVVLGLDGRCYRGEIVNRRLFADAVRRAFKEKNGSDQALQHFEQSLKKITPSTPYTLPGIMPNVAAGRIANLWNFQGPNLVLSQAGTSLAASIQWATERLLEGSCKLMIAGGICQGELARSATLAAPAHSHSKPLQEAGIALAICTRETAVSNNWPIAASLCLEKTISAGENESVGKDSFYLAGAQGAREITKAMSHPQPMTLHWPGSSYAFRFHHATPSAPKSEVWPKLAKATLQPQPCPSPAALPAEPWLLICQKTSLSAVEHWQQIHPKAGVHVICPDLLSAGTDLDIWESSLLDRFEKIPKPNQILVFATNSDATNLAMEEARSLLNAGFLAAKHFHSRLAAGQTQLATLFQGQTDPLSPASGLFSGFAKSLAREFPKAKIRAIASDGPGLGACLKQLARSFSESIVDWVFRQNSAYSWQAQEVIPKQDSSGPGDQSLIIATGGGRGVTAVLVKDLLEAHACRAILLGRTRTQDLPETVAQMSDEEFIAFEPEFYRSAMRQKPRPHPKTLRATYAYYRKAREILRNLKEMRATGAKVTYLAVDLTQAEAVKQALAACELVHGSPSLVLHGAGVQVSKATAKKSLRTFHQIHTTKMGGLHSLLNAMRHIWPQANPHIHLLTSAFSFFGNDGQPDYGAANEALNRLAAYHSSPSQRWSSLAWLGWAGIGMTQGSEYKALMHARNLHAVEAAEGAAIFRQLLASSDPQADYYLVGAGEREYYEVPWQAIHDSTSSIAAQTPSLDSAQETYHTFDPSQQPTLMHHLIDGKPTLPGALFIHLARQTAQKAMGTSVSLIQNLKFHRFAKIPSSGHLLLKSAWQQQGENEGVRLLSDFTHPSGRVLQKDILHFEARIGPASTKEFAAPTLSLGEAQSMRDPYINKDPLVSLSGPYACLHSIEIHEHQQIALFTMPEAYSSSLPWPGEMFLMDAMFRLAMITPPREQQLPLFVPSAAEKVIFHQDELPRFTQPLLLVAPIPILTGDMARNDGVFALDPSGQPLISFWGMEAVLRGHLSSTNPLLLVP